MPFFAHRFYTKLFTGRVSVNTKLFTKNEQVEPQQSVTVE